MTEHWRSRELDGGKNRAGSRFHPGGNSYTSNWSHETLKKKTVHRRETLWERDRYGFCVHGLPNEPLSLSTNAYDRELSHQRVCPVYRAEILQAYKLTN